MKTTRSPATARALAAPNKSKQSAPPAETLLPVAGTAMTQLAPWLDAWSAAFESWFAWQRDAWQPWLDWQAQAMQDGVTWWGGLTPFVLRGEEQLA